MRFGVNNFFFSNYFRYFKVSQKHWKRTCSSKWFQKKVKTTAKK